MLLYSTTSSGAKIEIYLWAGTSDLTYLITSSLRDRRQSVKLYLERTYATNTICHESGHNCLLDIYWMYIVYLSATYIGRGATMNSSGKKQIYPPHFITSMAVHCLGTYTVAGIQCVWKTHFIYEVQSSWSTIIELNLEQGMERARQTSQPEYDQSFLVCQN